MIKRQKKSLQQTEYVHSQCAKKEKRKERTREGERQQRLNFLGSFFSNTTLLERKYDGENKSNTNNNMNENVAAPISYVANDISKQNLVSFIKSTIRYQSKLVRSCITFL